MSGGWMWRRRGKGEGVMGGLERSASDFLEVSSKVSGGAVSLEGILPGNAGKFRLLHHVAS